MGSNTGKLLFGQEVELGFTLFDNNGKRFAPSEALAAFFSRCAGNLTHLRGRGSDRLYLANGSMLYPDVGHPELATAESASPTALLQSLRAGERLAADMAAALASEDGIGAVNLFRTTVDYAALDTTWGAHESYLSRRAPEQYARSVVPHLVSRIVYSGAGGFNNTTWGATFVLSPRAFHLNHTVGNDSQSRRAIFSLRDESLANGNLHRVHLICGEANCCELSTYLKVGSTALVLAMADAGVDLGLGDKWLRMAPLAMRRFAGDSLCRLRTLVNGHEKQTAIDIQRHYLEVAEAHFEAPFMPRWAAEVCRQWRRVLDLLQDDPMNLVGSLDWPTKLALFRQHVQRSGTLDWQSLPVWEKVLESAARVLDTRERLDCKRISTSLRSGKGAEARAMRELADLLGKHGLAWEDLDTLQVLRDELCELDLRYGQLYPVGIFMQLEAAGEIRDAILAPGQIDAALERAPEPGRARTRGDWVRRLASENSAYTCNWTGISGHETQLDLSDPFITEATWQPRQPRRARWEERPIELFDRP